MNTQKLGQAGSAFFVILIAIAMFGALSYAVFSGSRSGVSTLTADQARIQAQEILDYTEVIKKAVQTLRLRGCSESEINMQTPATIGWINTPTAPADKSCDVFELAGGKVLYQTVFPNARTDPTVTQHWWFNGQTAVKDIGTTSPELIMWAINLKPEVCDAINKILYGTSLADTETTGTHTIGFDGTFNLVADGIGDDTPTDIYAGKTMGCFPDYSFYAVLIAR